MRRLLILVAMLASLLALPLAAQPEFPELTGRVVDNADILSPETEAQLTTQLEAFEAQSQRQLVVVTLPTLQGTDIADYGYQLGREWGLGDAERNDGALLIVAPNEREVRIEVGYGLEGILTDAYSKIIIEQDIVPRFREGDMEGGIVAGTTAIANHLLLPEAEAIQLMTRQATEASGNSGEPVWVLPLLIVVPLLIILVPVVIGTSGSTGRTRYSGISPGGSKVSTYSSSESSWSPSSSGFSSSSSSSSSSSFSGGGGSFGGGGASGSW
ncbi:YgcG family protein [Erythrobacter sp. JK5]|uniref:TPM domain-containing protein n=1 Tax=Erythrobacter sp. JK5 TaxID=2829500 RepID=UPI001BA9EA44|nr:TPM domain-containing protein [Erythrobacter sp. JK5]QUL38229.1 TPM domain-containing protein [Erythrobacter sp. JK5]